VVFNASHEFGCYQVIMQIGSAGIVGWKEILKVGFIAHIYWLLQVQTYCKPGF